MTRICAWCETILSVGKGKKPQVTHVVCSGCLGTLKAQVNSAERSFATERSER